MNEMAKEETNLFDHLLQDDAVLRQERSNRKDLQTVRKYVSDTIARDRNVFVIHAIYCDI